MSNDIEREAFEAFWRQEMNTDLMPLDLTEYPMTKKQDQQYINHDTNRGWETWKAARSFDTGMQQRSEAWNSVWELLMTINENFSELAPTGEESALIEILDLATRTQQSKAEPVGWLNRFGEYMTAQRKRYHIKNGSRPERVKEHTTPVYTHPPTGAVGGVPDFAGTEDAPAYMWDEQNRAAWAIGFNDAVTRFPVSPSPEQGQAAVGCPCGGDDGMECPGPDGRLLCDDEQGYLTPSEVPDDE